MSRKIAIKRLTASDLTFFKAQFQKRPHQKQKAINLNAKILAGKLFPELDLIPRIKSTKLPIDLNIFGNDGKTVYNLQRKIVRSSNAKNWRLNGELVHDPSDEDNRFDDLEAGDYSVMEFIGENLPTGINLYLLRQAKAEDADVIELLKTVVPVAGRDSMEAISFSEFKALLESFLTEYSHPLQSILAIDSVLEDVVESGIIESDTFLKKPSNYTLSLEELQARNRAAEDTGRLGEYLVLAYLSSEKEKTGLTNLVWIADQNAIAPYDFSYSQGGSDIITDVKATKGPFSTQFHVSINELKAMAMNEERYDIIRCYNVTEKGCMLRIAHDLAPLATEILLAFGNLPLGVRPNGVAIKPATIDFGPEVEFVLDKTEEE
jgi:hypothetical protein